ncbi:MAG: 23S rRNA (adenine(1618)-N(6))-methyltransferase RlmF [Bacteroidetes bacterium]|nr:23S rRNA (adenine(1618)-N(6))-methyltransferase RlmF [Bacteroidota bacterium]
MNKEEKKNLDEKEVLHPRNKHRSRYNFKELIGSCPELSKFVFINKYNNETIDFADPAGVKTLNRTLLKQYYGVATWDIPQNYLCPPIPGRADYIHYIADLLATSNNGIIPKGQMVNCLDIGVGANCIYPIIGNYEYGWGFVGSDIDDKAIHSAKTITENNNLKEIEIREQKLNSNIFKGIIKPAELFDVTLCNPPFHSSHAEAQEGTSRKVRNLNSGKNIKPVLNFGGQNTELWCKGGEKEFVSKMISESALFPTSCFWYSSLVSKSENLPTIYYNLEKVKALEVRTIEMKQGNKISRFVAWTFLNPIQQEEWRLKRWCR